MKMLVAIDCNLNLMKVSIAVKTFTSDFVHESPTASGCLKPKPMTLHTHVRTMVSSATRPHQTTVNSNRTTFSLKAQDGDAAGAGKNQNRRQKQLNFIQLLQHLSTPLSKRNAWLGVRNPTQTVSTEAASFKMQHRFHDFPLNV